MAHQINYAANFFTREWKVNGLWNATLQNIVAYVQGQNVEFQVSPEVYSNPAGHGERADLAISALVGVDGGNAQFDVDHIPIITFEGKVAGASWTTTRTQVESWCDQVNDVAGQAGTSIWAMAAVGRYVRFWIYSNWLVQKDYVNANNRSRLIPVSWNATENPPTLRVDWAGGTDAENYTANTDSNADSGIQYEFGDARAHMIIAFMLRHSRGANVPHIAGAVW